MPKLNTIRLHVYLKLANPLDIDAQLYGAGKAKFICMTISRAGSVQLKLSNDLNK